MYIFLADICGLRLWLVFSIGFVQYESLFTGLSEYMGIAEVISQTSLATVMMPLTSISVVVVHC